MPNIDHPEHAERNIVPFNFLTNGDPHEDQVGPQRPKKGNSAFKKGTFRTPT